MAVEFGASIKLDSTSATEQMRKFAAKTTEASKALRKFQEETKATAQGGSKNVFRAHINSSQKANQQILKSIALIHDQGKAYSKLTDVQKSHVATADRLNRKYDESARVERQLVNIRKELRIVTASGLKTQKEADAIYNREAARLNQSTTAYKKLTAEKKKAAIAAKKEASAIDAAMSRFDKEYVIKKKLAQAEKQLNLLVKNGLITQQQRNRLLEETAIKTRVVVKENHKLISSQQRMIKMARLVSVYSRLLLGAYAAIRVARMFTEFEKTAEAVNLLQQKLEFLTGDSGAYKTLFDMTQEVGIKMESANKIITRFAVVTNRAFDAKTMADWSGTLIKSARATGTSTQEMTGALIQITQAMSAGRVMGDEYRSVTENLPLLTVALRDIFGRSTSSLKELSSQGLITNDILIEAFGRTKVLLEGFPDSTQTIEAAFGRMSSAWDNLVANISDSTISKDIANTLTDVFNYWSDISGGGEKQETKEQISGLKAGLSVMNERIAKLKEERKIRISMGGDKSFSQDLIEAVAHAEKFNKQLKITEEKYKVLTGTDAGTIAKKKADEALQAEREKDKIYKNQQKTLQLIEQIEGGKTIETIKQNAVLRDNLLMQKLFAKEVSESITPEQYFDLSDKNEKAKQIAIDKNVQSQIDAELRLEGFTTNNNIKKIQAEFEYSGKIQEIKKKHADAIHKIASLQRERELSLTKKDGSKSVGISGEEARIERLRIQANQASEIKTHMEGVAATIEKTTNAVLRNTALVKGDLSAALGFEKVGILTEYETKLDSLEKKIRSLGDAKLYEQVTGNSLSEDRQRWIAALQAERDAKLEDVEPFDKLSAQQEQDERILETKLYHEQLDRERREREIAAEIEHYDTIYNLKSGSLQASYDFGKAIRDKDYKGAMKNGSAMLANLATTSKKMFEIQKALSLATAVAELPSAVMSTYKNAGGFPWGVVPAGIMLATGLQQINAIKSSTFGSTSASGGGLSTGGGSTSSPVQPVAPTTTDTAQPTQTGGVTNVNLVGRDKTFTSEDIDILFEEIGDALDRGDRILFTSDSRQALELG